MAKAMFLAVVFMHCFILNGVYCNAFERHDKLFESLVARIESLEASDAAKKVRIAEMESEFKVKLTACELEISDLKIELSEMESRFMRKETTMLSVINELKSDLNTDTKNSDEQLSEKDDTEKILPEQIEIYHQSINTRKERTVPEAKVAFYATNTDNRIHTFRSNQIITFQDVVTNDGNGFNKNTSVFIAPVDGTFVLHATIMSIDINGTNQSSSAYFDVSGTAYSMFWITPTFQSSQMLVIDLKSGQNVRLINDFDDSNYLGAPHSSFSGFLLYQNYPSESIIGK